MAQSGGGEMHWKTGKEKDQHQHNIQGTDAFFRAVLIPTLKASLHSASFTCKPCKAQPLVG